jgi:hypothetical protein
VSVLKLFCSLRTGVECTELWDNGKIAVGILRGTSRVFSKGIAFRASSEVQERPSIANTALSAAVVVARVQPRKSQDASLNLL